MIPVLTAYYLIVCYSNSLKESEKWKVKEANFPSSGWEGNEAQYLHIWRLDILDHPSLIFMMQIMGGEGQQWYETICILRTNVLWKVQEIRGRSGGWAGFAKEIKWMLLPAIFNDGLRDLDSLLFWKFYHNKSLQHKTLRLLYIRFHWILWNTWKMREVISNCLFYHGAVEIL